MSVHTLSCPACRTPLQSDPSAQGQQVRCPKCNTLITVPAAGPSSPTWYIAHNKQKLGPYSSGQLKQLAASGQLTPGDMVLREGERKWVAAGAVKGLFPNAETSGHRPAPEARPPSTPLPPRRGVPSSPVIPEAVLLEESVSTSTANSAIGPAVLWARWRWLAGGGVAALALIVGLVVFFNTRSQPLSPEQMAGAPNPSDPSPPPPKAAPNAKDLILGYWESAGEEKGAVEFRKDGSVTMLMPGAPAMTGTYRFVDDQVVQVDLDFMGQTISQKLKVTISKDELATTDEANRVDKFRRAVPKPPPVASSREPIPRQRYARKVDAGAIADVALAPDGKRIAFAIVGGTSPDGALKLWDAAKGEELASLQGHRFGVESVAFTPDGKTLASGGGDLVIKLWDVAARKEKASLPTGHQSSIKCLVFTSDGKTLASASDGIKLWYVDTGKQRAAFKGHDGGTGAVVFTPDGKTLASVGQDSVVKLWAVATGKERMTFEGQAETLRALAITADGQLLASVDLDKIKLWDVATGKERATLGGHKDRVSSVAFTPNGKFLASASLDKTVKLWDVAEGRELGTLRGHAEGLTEVVISADGKTMVVVDLDSTVYVYDLSEDTNTGEK